MSANSALTKLKCIIALLAQNPEHKRLHDYLRDCVHHIPHYASRLYAIARNTETNQIRCPLKYRCPKCMDPINIKAARKGDWIELLKAARSIGADRRGRVWLLRWKSSERHDSRRMSKALGQSDDRRIPAIRGVWGGEICGTFKSIVSSNGPNCPANSESCFVFNALIFAPADSLICYDSLLKRFPDLELEEFHGCLEDAWALYLNRWATAQVTMLMPSEIIAWMTYKGRLFSPIGCLRGSRKQSEQESTEHRQATLGKSALLGFFHQLDIAEQVLARMERDLPLKASNLLDRVLEPEERTTIMATLKRQVQNVLKPKLNPDDVLAEPMTALMLELRLEELRKQNARLIKMLEDREKDATSTRRVVPPDRLQ